MASPVGGGRCPPQPDGRPVRRSPVHDALGAGQRLHPTSTRRRIQVPAPRGGERFVTVLGQPVHHLGSDKAAATDHVHLLFAPPPQSWDLGRPVGAEDSAGAPVTLGLPVQRLIAARRRAEALIRSSAGKVSDTNLAEVREPRPEDGGRRQGGCLCRSTPSPTTSTTGHRLELVNGPPPAFTPAHVPAGWTARGP